MSSATTEFFDRKTNVTQTTTRIKGVVRVTLPVRLLSTEPVGPVGSIIYNAEDKCLYYATDQEWVKLSSTIGIDCITDADDDTKVCVAEVPDTITFYTDGGGNVATERARITTAGQLLIGTTVPSGGELLHVAGDAEVTGKLTVGGLIDPTGVAMTETTTPGPFPGVNPGFGTVWIQDTAPTTLMFTDDDGNIFNVGGGLSQAQIIDDDGDTIVSTQQVPGVDSDIIIFTTDGTEAARINPTQQVLIGATVPVGAELLQVNGDVHITAAGALSVDTVTATTLNGNLSLNGNGTGGLDLNGGSVGGIDADTTGQLNLDSSQAAPDAVRIVASDVAGGIDVDAGTAGITIDTTGGVSIDAGADSNFTVTGSDLTLASTLGSVIVNAGEAVSDAVDVNALAGGVTIDAGGAALGVGDIALTSTLASIVGTAGEAVPDAIRFNASAGGVDIDAGGAGGVGDVGDINLNSTLASIVLTAGEAVSDAINVDATAGGVDVDCALQLSLTSTQAAADALRLLASNAAGGLDVDTGTGGMTLDTTGGISLDAADPSNFTVTGVSDDLTLNSTLGRVVVAGGEAVSNAVDVSAPAGGIEIDTGGVAGTGDITVTSALSSIVVTAGEAVDDAIDISATNGGVEIDANGAAGTGDISLTSTLASIVLTANEAVDDAIDINSISGGVDVDCVLQLALTSSEAASDAIRIHASNAAGGIDIDAGTGGIDIDTTGPFTVDAASIAYTTSGQLYLESTQAASDAIRVIASNAAGGIDVDAGTGGVAIDTTGAISLDAAAASNFSVTGAAVDLTLSSATGSVNVTAGEAAADAVRIFASNAAGGIDVDAGTGGLDVDTTGQINLDSSQAAATAVRIFASNAAGGIDVDAGTTGVNVDSTGAISLDAAAASNFSVTGAAVDLTLSSATGSVNVTAGEAAADAVRINASNAAGGIDVDAGTGGLDVDTTGQINLDSSQAAATAVRIFASNAAGGIDVDAGTTGLDVDTTGQINLDSSQAAVTAVRIFASNAAGGIDVDAGTGGVTIDTSGAISLDSSLSSNFTTSGVGSLTLATTFGSTTVSSVLGTVTVSSGKAAADAITILASDVAGGINVDAGTSGLDLDTTGQINLDSSQAAASAVRIFASNAAGGIDIDAGTGGITIDTTDAMTVTASTFLSLIASSALGGVTVIGTFRRSPQRVYYEEFYLRKPGINADIQNASEAVREIANTDFEVQGTNGTSATTAQNTAGGVRCTTTTATNDQVIIAAHTDTSQSGWFATAWGTSNQVVWEAAITTGATITSIIYWLGLKLTNTSTLTTDNDQVFFRFSTADGNTTWRVIDSIANVDTNTDSTVSVTASTRYRFRISIDSTRVARCYVDSDTGTTEVATFTLRRTTGVLTSVSLFPYVGVQTLTTAARVLDLHYQKISCLF